MKILGPVVVVILFVFNLPALAGLNSAATVNAKLGANVTLIGEHLFIPIEVENANEIVAVRLVLKYNGIFEDLQFEPAEFIRKPLVMPITIDRNERIIDISIATTGRTVTRASEGVIGYLRLDSKAKLTSLSIVSAEFIDGSYRMDVFKSSPVADESSEDDEKSDPKNQIIKYTHLYQNYPNPANPTTTISFDLHESTRVRLNVYDVTGGLVRSIVNDVYEQGQYRFNWDGLDEKGESVSSGIYFYRLRTRNGVETKKLMILK